MIPFGGDRLMVESAARMMANDPAIFSVNLKNGWKVTRFSIKELPYVAVRKFNKSRSSLTALLGK
jgi:hypothetical protein